MSTGFQCHYEVLSIPQDADSTTIKKAHRKLAIQFHPDKNLGDDDAAEKFRLVQEAYECLSDVSERKWYDEHRDALLKGWSPNAGGSGGDGDGIDMLFDVIPFMHAHCYTGYDDDDEHSFYNIYGHVFASIAKEEADAMEASSGDNNNNKKKEDFFLPHEFGNSQTSPKETVVFYQLWEGFVSRQTFSWADKYNVKDAENRRVRRAMDDENQKARKVARKARNEDVLALVHFCKRRDPRMKALKAQQEQEKAAKEKQQAENIKLKKKEKQQAREQWRQEAEEELAQAEEMDRLAGRVRLADLEDDYDYGGGKKKGKNGGKKKNRVNQPDEPDETEANKEENENFEGTTTNINKNGEADVSGGNIDKETGSQGESFESDGAADDESPHLSQPQDDDEASSEEDEDEPDVWLCECCRKDFKSQGQMDNHMKSKKHKEAYKKYQKKIEKELM